MGRDDLAASAAYQPEPTAAAAARRFVRDTLQEWLVTGAEADCHGLVDDAVLLTSELVTNAVVHAGTPVEVTCRLADGAVEVVVSDCHPARLVPEAACEHSPAERTSGRGLLLPSALASAWGVTYGRSTKAVWCRLGLGVAAAALGNGTAGSRELARHGGHQGPADGGMLASALRLAARTRGDAAADAPAGNGRPGHGEATAGPGDLGYQKLLASTVKSARAAVGADAACVLMADEDGDLRLSTATGAIPQPGEGTGPGGAPMSAAGISLASVQAPAGAAPSILTVPFVVDGRVTGLLAAVSAAPRRFNETETARLQHLADTRGPALQQAWLSDLERIRRGRMAALTEARGLLMGGLTPDEIMDMVGRAAVPRLAPWCAVLTPAGGAGLRATYLRHRDPARAGALGWLLDRVCGDAEPDLGSWQQADPGSTLRWPLAVPGPDAPPGAGEVAAGGAWCFPLGGGPADDRGILLIGGDVAERLPREVAALAADLACRAGLALAGAPVGTR